MCCAWAGCGPSTFIRSTASRRRGRIPRRRAAARELVVGLDRRDTGIEVQCTLDPFRDAEQAVVFPIRADDLQAERKAVLAESNRKRHGGHADKSPRRAIFGVTGIA